MFNHIKLRYNLFHVGSSNTLYLQDIILILSKKKYQKTLIVWTLICEPHNKKQIITHKESGNKTTHKQTPPQNINNTQLTHKIFRSPLLQK